MVKTKRQKRIEAFAALKIKQDDDYKNYLIKIENRNKRIKKRAEKMESWNYNNAKPMHENSICEVCKTFGANAKIRSKPSNYTFNMKIIKVCFQKECRQAA